MNLPDINDTITTPKALALCRHFGLDYLVARIEADLPEKYADWTFDGCSGLPDQVMGFFTDCDWKDITYQCCLPHDLCYAYGDKGNKSERKQVDLRFYNDLINKAGMKEWCAAAFLAGVRAGGAEVFGLSFSWGFASPGGSYLFNEPGLKCR